MALTIRTSDEDLQTIERLKSVLAESTASKALLKSAAAYLQLRDQYKDLLKEFTALETTVNSWRDLAQQREDICNQIRELDLADSSKFDCESPPGIDRDLVVLHSSLRRRNGWYYS